MASLLSHLSSRWRRQKEIVGHAWHIWHLWKHAPHDIPLYVQKCFTRLKGPFVKVAQCVSMIPGIIPYAYQEPLRALCHNASPLAWSVIENHIKDLWGSEWHKKFSFFEEKACFSASWGQVHKASLHDGREVACKIQYPFIQKALHTDMCHMRWMASLYRMVGAAFDTDILEQTLEQRFYEELDYVQEARMLEWFGNFFHAYEDIIIPKCIDTHCTKNIITMTWIPFPSIAEAVLTQNERNYVGETLFYTWYAPFFAAGVMHGDPHEGNILYSSQKQLGLVDFGCVQNFSPCFVKVFYDICKNTITGSQHPYKDYYTQWGLQMKPHSVDAMNAWIAFLMRPFASSGKKFFKDSFNIQEGKHLFFTLHRALSLEGAIQMPSEFFLISRVTLVLFSLLSKLEAHIDWQKIMARTLEHYGHKKAL